MQRKKMVECRNIKVSVWQRPARGRKRFPCEGTQFSSFRMKDAEAEVAAHLMQRPSGCSGVML